MQSWGFTECLGIEVMRSGLGLDVVREMAVESNRGFVGHPWRTSKLSLMDWMARTRFIV